MRLRVEEKLMLDAGLGRQLDVKGAAAVQLLRADEERGRFRFAAVEEMGIGQLGRGFELDGFRAGQSAKLAYRSFAPGRFAVVGEDFGLGVEGDFRIVAVGRFEVESISPRFFVALASNGAFEGGGEQFAEGT